MASSARSFFLVILLQIVSASSSSLHATRHDQVSGIKSAGRRVLLSFKETPRGSNATFKCSPSGPCLPCLYSEKKDEKYRCSETGYRIPFKCMEILDGAKSSNEQNTPKAKGRSTLEMSIISAKSEVMLLHEIEELAASVKPRSLLEDSSSSKKRSQSYTTYRSCVPAQNEEKLSVIGFEGIVLVILLISGTIVYIRKRQMMPTPGVSSAGRSQSSSRF